MATEKPTFTVEAKTAHYEIRNYDSMLVAETQVNSEFEDAGNIGFSRLFDYISGNNKPQAAMTTLEGQAAPAEKIAMTAPVSQTKIAMTAPVSQTKIAMTAPVSQTKIAMAAPVSQAKNQREFLIHFTMPKKFTLEDIPVPNNPQVQIRQIPSRKLAVYTYSGSWSEARYQKKLAAFRAELKKNGVQTTGEPSFSRFNSPFSLPFLRHNEIWIEVLN